MSSVNQGDKGNVPARGQSTSEGEKSKQGDQGNQNWIDNMSKVGGSGNESNQDAANDRQLMQDMDTAYEQYTSKNPTTAAVGQQAGQVAKGVFQQLTGAGFSFFEVIKNIYVVFDLIQKHGGDIRRIVDEFRKMFGGGNQPQQ